MRPASSLMPFVAITAAIAVYSVMDTTMKFASLALGAYSATFWRSLLGFVIVLPLWLSEGARWPDRDLLKLHAIRGVVTAGVATSFFWGLVRLPLAEAIAISFIAPLIALFLAAVLLGEKIGKPAIGASLLGLVGVVSRCGAGGGGSAGFGLPLCVEPHPPTPAGFARQARRSRGVPERDRRADPVFRRAVAAGGARCRRLAVGGGERSAGRDGADAGELGL
ncbi:MAG: family transporter, partial [Proteobacteria bacterium]|nr:family transporter [Pseudomonadota bacterium]